MAVPDYPTCERCGHWIFIPDEGCSLCRTLDRVTADWTPERRAALFADIKMDAAITRLKK